mgnify:CR=1 FL=1
MDRREAVASIVAQKPKAIIFASNGFTARELFSLGDRQENFYVIGAMGFASSVALGYSLCAPEKETIALDGDANILMNLPSLVTIAAQKPNLIHVVLDNGISASTGGQKSYAADVDLAKIAKACGYSRAIELDNKTKLEIALKRNERPLFILAKISAQEFEKPRVGILPEILAERMKKVA